MESDSEIDNIINELKMTSVSAPFVNSQEITTPVVTDDSVNQYVYQKTAEVIQAGMMAITSLSQNISMGADPKEVAALASLIGATTKAIDSMNKINLQQKQAAVDVKIKEMDIAGKKDIVSSLPSANNNILIATRDEIIDQFVNYKPKKSNLDLM